MIDCGCGGLLQHFFRLGRFIVGSVDHHQELSRLDTRFIGDDAVLRNADAVDRRSQRTETTTNNRVLQRTHQSAYERSGNHKRADPYSARLIDCELNARQAAVDRRDGVLRQRCHRIKSSSNGTATRACVGNMRGVKSETGRVAGTDAR